MSLKKCKECGKDVSTKAGKCPHCGAKLKTGTGIGCLGLIGVILLVGMFGNMLSESNKTSKPKTAKEIRKERIESTFSAWDGSHMGLEKLIKRTMNDPDSYEHVKTVYSDKGNYLIVKTTFRGKNAFGGVVTNWIMAKADLDGNIIEVISRGP